jgi:hypothetical protein
MYGVSVLFRPLSFLTALYGVSEPYVPRPARLKWPHARQRPHIATISTLASIRAVKMATPVVSRFVASRFVASQFVESRQTPHTAMISILASLKPS